MSSGLEALIAGRLSAGGVQMHSRSSWLVALGNGLIGGSTVQM